MRSILSFFVLAALLLFSAPVRADLTSGQATAFRTNVKSHNGDAVATAYANHDIDALLAFYNATAAGPVVLWRADIKPSELAGAIVMSEFVVLSTAAQNGQLLLLQLGAGGLDATNANVRASFTTIWTGKTTLTALTAIAQRSATAFEAISSFLSLVSGANVCSVYGYRLSFVDVRDALWNNQGTPL